MPMRVRIPKYRGVWEGECLVEGCPATCTIAGEWFPYPHTPSFFYCASDRQGDLPDGWHYQHHHRLGHGDVSVDRGLFCPAHAPVWRSFLAEVDRWESERQAQRKTWWLTFKTFFAGSKPPPTPPYEMHP